MSPPRSKQNWIRTRNSRPGPRPGFHVRGWSCSRGAPRPTGPAARRSNECTNDRYPSLVRILGVDPGLTRCGVGIVDVGSDRRARFVYAGVIRTSSETAPAERLLAVSRGIEALLAEYAPHAVAIEQVFAQHNLRTVMGTAQASGVAMTAAAARGLPVGSHTPSEIKAAITGYGSAAKQQVGTMVMRILSLDEVPQPADAADALALAICHGWRGGGSAAHRPTGSEVLTPAQQAWQQAEKASRNRRRVSS